MSDVGDAVELTYTTAPGATVTMSWTNRTTGTVVHNNIAVTELLNSDDEPTGKFPITLVGTSAGTWEAQFTATGAATGVESYFERFDVTGGPVPFATVSEYQGIYGTLSAPRQALARALLRRASGLIRDSYPSVDERLAAGTAASNSIGQAVLNMTARVLRNMSGLRSETTGPFSRAYDIDAASGMLELTDSDRALLADAGALPGRRKGAIGTFHVKGGLVPPRRPGRRWPRGDQFPRGW